MGSNFFDGTTRRSNAIFRNVYAGYRDGQDLVRRCVQLVKIPVESGVSNLVAPCVRTAVDTYVPSKSLIRIQ